MSSAYSSFKSLWLANCEDWIDNYAHRRQSFVYGLLPEWAVQMSTSEVLLILQKRLGEQTLKFCLEPVNSRAWNRSENHWPARFGKSAATNRAASQADEPPFSQNTGTVYSAHWMKRVNMAGINIRTIGNFWNLVKYALTLPASQNAIHLLPIWEPGVVSSLYGIASWNINSEFFSHELYETYPYLDTVERQLKVTVNVLHAMGKAVGMDVIPHTDRYSEIVLANPHFFEWLRRKGTQITDHSNNLHEQVQLAILDFLKKSGSNGITYPSAREDFFGEKFGEANRILALFGMLRDYGHRSERRAALMDHLFRLGFEPVPATMAPPYRGLVVDPASVTVDGEGREWVDYAIEYPTSMSRVFGPLTRFKFYENKNDNRDWEIDFTKPKKEVWAYFTEAYASIAMEYGFDFMRGDMSHVQMRPEGVPAEPDEFYDPLQAVRNYIQKEKSHFGYFAESFLGPAGYLAYGDEVDHLEAADADSTLGDLQSMVVGSPEFLQNFRWYLDILATRHVTPCFTLMTGDKDDPRFDKFYVGGNEARMFMALFLPDMPSYMGLGFECRDTHLFPAPNEHYTKLFVFKIDDGPKATKGGYVWGKNAALFSNLLEMRLFADFNLAEIADCTTHWLLPPDPTGHKKIIAWTMNERPDLLFIVNLDWEQEMLNIKIPCTLNMEAGCICQSIFTTYKEGKSELIFNGKSLHLAKLAAGECVIFALG